MTTQTTEAVGLRERALAALQEARRAAEGRQRESEAAEREDRSRLLIRLLKDRLGVSATAAQLEWANNHPSFIMDGLTFVCHRSRVSGHTIEELRLVDDCPLCGDRATSKDIYSLDTLGELLGEFQPNWGHECTRRPRSEPTAPAASPPPTTADQLLELLGTFIGERIAANRAEDY
jgi:hypothetical protein